MLYLIRAPRVPLAALGAAPTVRTQTGTARIQKTVTATQTGTARIRKTVTVTQTGTARIRKTVAQTQTGVARIEASILQTQTATGRIQTTEAQIQTGLGRIQSAAAQVQTAQARIQSATAQAQTGKARIRTTSLHTQTGQSKIQRTTQQVQTGLASIVTAGAQLQTQTGRARIQATIAQAQTGKSRIQQSAAQTQNGRARIQSTETVLLEQAVYETLAGLSDLVAILGSADKIFPRGDTQNRPLPYIKHWPVAAAPVHTHEALVALEHYPFYQINLFARSAQTCRLMAEAIKDGLQGAFAVGSTSIEFFLAGERFEDYDLDLRIAQLVLDYEVWFANPALL